ncbi:DUF6011 domain-containing protein [Streptomyces sp. NPDC054883]
MVRHKPGECPFPSTTSTAANQAPSAQAAPVTRETDESATGYFTKQVPATATVPAARKPGEPLTGYFTAQFGDDQGDYVTIRILRQPDDSRFKPGSLVASYLRGRDNETDYTKFAHLDEQGQPRIWKLYAANARLRAALAAVLGDQRGAGEAWARQSKRCWRCGRLLTTPDSLERLMGEECDAKM